MVIAMKKWSFKRIVTIALLSVVSFLSYAEEPEGRKSSTTFREKVMPRFMKAQFAGSIGAVSIGIGWNYGRDHWETDFIAGLVPRNSDHAMLTLTLKQNYLPWKINLGKNFMCEPLTCGIFLNTLLDNDFWVKNPDKYPSGYYTFSTKMRIHVFTGQRVTYKFKRQDKFVKAVSLFYEINTADLYLINAITNSYIKPKDFLSLAIGIKAQIR